MKYRDEDGIHISNEKTDFDQNTWFASKHALEKNTHSRRDDIIMLVYSMVFLINQYREVKKLGCTADNIGPFKIKVSPYEFCYGTEFGSILEEAYSYEFDQKPNYVKLINLMKMILIGKNLRPSKSFTWYVPPSKDDDECDIPEEEDFQTNTLKLT